jgi:DNA polymerase-3 subunit chi
LDNKAIFYILNAENDTESSICKIIKRYFELNNTILVSSKNKILLESINKLLWTFEQLSFIPHSTDKRYDSNTNIILVETGYKNDSIVKKDYNVFINLDDEVKTDYHNHEIIVELVDTNEDKKKIAREKYFYYKNNNLNVKHENL